MQHKCKCGASATHTRVVCYHGSDPRWDILLAEPVCERHTTDWSSDRPQWALIGVHTLAQASSFYSRFDDPADIDWLMSTTEGE